MTSGGEMSSNLMEIRRSFNKWGKRIPPPSTGCYEELTNFLDAKREKFCGFAAVDPHDPEAPAILRKKIEDQGYRGLKLYPLYSERGKQWLK